MPGCERFGLNIYQLPFAMYVKVKDRLTKRALDWWDSARFQAVFYT